MKNDSVCQPILLSIFHDIAIKVVYFTISVRKVAAQMKPGGAYTYVCVHRRQLHVKRRACCLRI